MVRDISPSVLLVDDDPDDHTMLRIARGRASLNWRLSVAHDADGCFVQLDSRDPPRLIMLDLNMPRVDGWSVLAQIRDHARYCVTPVVIYTTASDYRFVERAYALGANAYVVKPGTAAELVDYLTAMDRFWFETVDLPTSEPKGREGDRV